MNLLRAILHDLALVALVAAGALGCAVLWKAMGTVDGINATLVNINRPCKGPASPDACGTLAQINKGVIRMDDLATTAQMQVKQSGLLITATTRNMDTVAASVTGEVAALQDTTKALTATAQTANTDLQAITDHLTPVMDAAKTTVGQAGTTIEDFQPVETAATKMLTDGDALVNSQDVTRFLKGSADTSQQVAIIATQGAAIATDVHKEADALVAPQPWWKHLYGYTSTGVNVACLVTHSCPF